MPTLYEAFFWVGILIIMATLWGVFSKSKADLYVSDYELNKLNENKH